MYPLELDISLFELLSTHNLRICTINIGKWSIDSSKSIVNITSMNVRCSLAANGNVLHNDRCSYYSTWSCHIGILLDYSNETGIVIFSPSKTNEKDQWEYSLIWVMYNNGPCEYVRCIAELLYNWLTHCRSQRRMCEHFVTFDLLHVNTSYEFDETEQVEQADVIRLMNIIVQLSWIVSTHMSVWFVEEDSISFLMIRSASSSNISDDRLSN
jgi:hypothetical protein